MIFALRAFALFRSRPISRGREGYILIPPDLFGLISAKYFPTSRDAVKRHVVNNL